MGLQPLSFIFRPLPPIPPVPAGPGEGPPPAPAAKTHALNAPDSLQLSQAPVRPGRKVLFIGDSHTVGPFGAALDQKLRDAGAQVTTVGSCGSAPATWFSGAKTTCGFFRRDANGTTERPYWKTPHATPKLPGLLAETKPDVVVVALGANLRNQPEDYIKAQTARAIEAVEASGAELVWVGPPQARPDVIPPAERERMDKALREAVAGHGPYISSLPLTHYPARGGDGIHYHGTEGTRTAKAWADNVAARLTQPTP